MADGVVSLHTSEPAGHSVITPTDSHCDSDVVLHVRHDGTLSSGNSTQPALHCGISHKVLRVADNIMQQHLHSNNSKKKCDSETKTNCYLLSFFVYLTNCPFLQGPQRSLKLFQVDFHKPVSQPIVYHAKEE